MIMIQTITHTLNMHELVTVWSRNIVYARLIFRHSDRSKQYEWAYSSPGQHGWVCLVQGS